MLGIKYVGSKTEVVEAEKEKKKAAASVNTQPLTLLQRHQGYGKPAGRSTARFVVEQPLLPFASVTV